MGTYRSTRTDPLWANHATTDKISLAVIGTSASSVKSRQVMSDPWAAIAAIGAAGAAGELLAQGIRDQVRRADWFSGPAQTEPATREFPFEQVGEFDEVWTVNVADTPQNRATRIARCIF